MTTHACDRSWRGTSAKSRQPASLCLEAHSAWCDSSRWRGVRRNCVTTSARRPRPSPPRCPKWSQRCVANLRSIRSAPALRSHLVSKQSLRHASRLIGVYNANGTLRGELSYFVKARLGAAHSALCDITHGLVRETRLGCMPPELPLPFETFHQDDQPEDVRLATGNTAPVVVADTNTGIVVLREAELTACEGSPEKLREALETALAQAEL